ncbi:glycosyltransferase [Planotetraspora sp. A-T 1434]|uniref:glycosyltransferase n=1 Tax=Planotetraspora sp. A-T 1434 TaxID=2979219 RepID=UPI0021BFB90F|nr:glycosyltransferase [Planotetraspora sp. A-T 1434]MCT9931986.1 glycosyltransferase [Planotetraspora sp. A-T 1434]
MSVIIPAHNEATVIGRLLSGLLTDAEPGEIDVVVVANGCSDGTADVARSFPGVRVLETPVPSKREALRMGAAAAAAFPVLYVDADVELGTADARALCATLARDGILATAPERRLPLADRPWLVRSYYAVWTRLPEVRAGLFGRGVIAVSEKGQARLDALPPVMADDLAASLAFEPGERAVTETASVVVHPPRTMGDLMRRRVRAVTSVAELGEKTGQPGGQARTSVRDLLGMARAPRLIPHLAVFLAVTVLARARARKAVRRGDFSTWLRDESSR